MKIYIDPVNETYSVEIGKMDRVVGFYKIIEVINARTKEHFLKIPKDVILNSDKHKILKKQIDEMMIYLDENKSPYQIINGEKKYL